ncbi:MAG: integration host factor subunit beta [Treponema sp.]|nr:integration host factor subunit beta [Treponema sp.]
MISKKITKYDLVEAVYQNSKHEKKEIQQVTDCLIEELKKSLARGFTIELRGFGTFEPRLRKERSAARNPKTGVAVRSRAHYVAAFRAGRELKSSLLELPVEES